MADRPAPDQDPPRRARRTPPVTATGGLAASVRERLGDLAPAERKVARALLADYPDAAFETVPRLAARAGVSGPTVVRFAARLGYTGYPAFQAPCAPSRRPGMPRRSPCTRAASSAAGGGISPPPHCWSAPPVL